MLFLKYLMLTGCIALLAAAAIAVLYDIYIAYELDQLVRRKATGSDSTEAPSTTPSAAPLALRTRRRAVRWELAAKLCLIGAALGLAGESILVVPDGMAGVRISQLSGVRAGTLYAGTHFIVPLVERVSLFDVRDQVFETAALQKRDEKLEALVVQAREGLPVGLAVTVRYRIDARRLDYIQANLPQPVDQEIVAPVVISAFHELAPNYVVRDLFATKREDFRAQAARIITQRLAGDGVVVKEVLLRNVDLPDEYAKGLEDLLLKEQEDDRVTVDQEIEKKRVVIAESQAEAAKVRDVKRAEASAASQVIMAKAESDSMQYTLPLKQKQIEQSRLEAEARKEATLENAEAAAQAKVIDSKAEQQRENLLAEAAANRIRMTSQAEAEQMQLEAAALKANPMLVQLTVAQRLSDRVQIMMVPNDGKFFFANDALRSAVTDAMTSPAGPSAANDPPGAGNPAQTRR
jgi:regulator of protease activity HflC (stomatin/prohibitin superfamily)